MLRCGLLIVVFQCTLLNCGEGLVCGILCLLFVGIVFMSLIVCLLLLLCGLVGF